MGLHDDRGQKFYLIQHKEGLYHAKKDESEERAFSYPIPKLVVSTWLKKIVEEEYRGEAELLLNPIDRKMFYPWEREKPKDEIRIMLLHHNYEWKGTREGVEMVNELKKKYNNIKLILFGLRSKDQEYDCDEYYYDLPQDRLAWIYSNADIYLCPSWDEGSGLPNMEAMACKCAVVTYDNGGSWDYAIDGETAMVAKRREKEDLKNKLEKLIIDTSLRVKIAKAGYEKIMSMPTWDEQAERFENILKKYNKK
jgi:glycosyltransferase involved in cell wall biosynthesis